MDSVTAKNFLISRVIQQTETEHSPLSEIEKKMLHFSEAYPSLPDMFEVNAEFERNYDSDEYEAKIAGLLRRARDFDRRESPAREEQWKNALDALRTEDHYILVMVAQAFRDRANAHRVRDYLIYIAIAIGVVVLILLASFRAPH